MTTHPRPDWSSLLETVKVDVVCVAKAPGDEGSYSVTCMDAETGQVIGRRRLHAAGDGPPRITFGDLAELMGGPYRCVSILVEIETRKLARRTRRISDMLRRRRRGWLRHTGYGRPAVAFESKLERDFLAEVSL
jgi:hypothetical protein